jgi:hypothetical protein
MNKTILWAAAIVLCGCSAKDTGGDGDDAGDAGTTAPGDAGATSAASADGTGPGGQDAGQDTGPVTAGVDDDGGPGGPPPVNFDLGGIPDAGEPACGGNSGDPEFSYIWIANSSQDTVSKINTVTLLEEGRYMTRDVAGGSPSRTSVSLSGDVAVANRSGGLTKFYANPENCTDSNGNGVIETSSGSADIKAWNAEECRAWYTPFTYTSQRPVAWTQGEWSAQQCAYLDQKVWTAGVIANTTIEINLVDGDSGIVEDSVQIPTISSGFYGMYGGAVDTEGNFWASQLGGGQLLRVNINDLTDYEHWTAPYGGYGMTVGKSGYVFTCNNQVGRFDPATETWDGASVGGGGGCMEDNNGILWMANSPLVGIDVETLAVVHSYPLPDYVHGVSIDFEGYVWGVSMNTNAYRVDPNTGVFDTVGGLVGPYTYSDMTGFALNAVGGGGQPSG